MMINDLHLKNLHIKTEVSIKKLKVLCRQIQKVLIAMLLHWQKELHTT